MNLTIRKKDNEVKTISQWPKPKKNNQWKEGRSAWAMANYVLNSTDDFKNMIKQILADCQIDIQSFICEPEAAAGLGTGFGRGGSRNHDLLMIGSKDCVIGIEAKVSEPFDREIGKVICEGGTRKDRALSLIRFLASRYEEDNQLMKIGYQLFTATRGTIRSAEKEKKHNAIFLVIVFTGCVDKEKEYIERCRKNDAVFNSFLNFVNADENGMIKDNKKIESINCWIKKVEVEVKKANGIYTFKYKQQLKK